jgi:hypothetical protein
MAVTSVSGPFHRLPGERIPMNQIEPNTFNHLEILASLPASDVIEFLLQMCKSRDIEIPETNPSLQDIFFALKQRCEDHRCTPRHQFAGGPEEWHLVFNDLNSLKFAVEKIISGQTQLDSGPDATFDSPGVTEFESLNGDRTSGRAGERPPDEGRTTPERPPDDRRSTPDRDANEPRSGADDQPAGASTSDSESKSANQSKKEKEEEALRVARAEYLAQILRERMSRSPLDDLPPERQKILFELLNDGVPSTIVLEMIMQSEPLGWNLETSASSLKRFKKRYGEQHKKAELARVAEEARKIANDPGADTAQFAEATQRLVQVRLFKNASDDETGQLDFLCKVLDRQRRTNLAERRLQLAEKLKQPPT